MHALSSCEGLDHGTMWHAMRLLLERLNGTLDSATAIDDCLDIVVELLGADRGLIVMTFEGGATHTITARKACKPLSPEQREEISSTIVREALDSSSFVQCLPLERGDPSASMATFGIVAALAAPLPGRAPSNAARGVLYVDFRNPRKHLGDRHIEFFLAATTLVGATLDQLWRSEMTRANLKEAEIHCLESRRAPAPTTPGQPTDTWQTLQDERERLEQREQQLIRAALIRSSGVVAHAARELGIARTTLSSRIESLGSRTLREVKAVAARSTRER